MKYIQNSLLARNPLIFSILNDLFAFFLCYTPVYPRLGANFGTQSTPSKMPFLSSTVSIT